MYNVFNIRQLNQLDDHQFIVLKNRIRQHRKKPNCRKLARLIDELERHRTEMCLSSSVLLPDHDRDATGNASNDEEAYHDGDHTNSVSEKSGVRFDLDGNDADEGGEGGGEGEHLERGIWSLTFDARTEERANQSFHESKRYWIVEIQRPRDERVQVGEGMLLWFDSYSTIGSHDTVAEESCASVRFMEYRKSEAESHSQRPLHGQPVSARRAYYMFDFNPLFKYAQYGSACAGTPGNSLPSRDQPLFVPKMSSEVGADTFSCVLCLNCPRGTAPKFTLRAAYVAQTPVVGLEKGRVRKAKYASYVILMLATDIIVMTTAVLQVIGIYLFLIASVTVSVLLTVEVYDEHKERYGGSTAHAFDFVAHLETLRILYDSTGSWLSIAVFGARSSSPSRVTPVLDPVIDDDDDDDGGGGSGSNNNNNNNNNKKHNSSAAIKAIDDADQLAIYKEAVRKRTFRDPDLEGVAKHPVVAAAVRTFKRSKVWTTASEGAAILCDACGYGLMGHAVCLQAVKDVLKGDRIVLRYHEEKLGRLLSALYSELCREHEERRAHRDVLYGPEGTIDAYKRQLVVADDVEREDR